MSGAMPFYGSSAQKIKTFFVVHPIVRPSDSLHNRIARWRAYLKVVVGEYPHTAAYVDAELWRLDVVETALFLLES